MSNVHIIERPKPNAECVRVLKQVLEDAKAGNVRSVALVIVEKPGEFRVTGAGTDVDGLRDGTVELFKQLERLLGMAENAEAKVILNA